MESIPWAYVSFRQLSTPWSTRRGICPVHNKEEYGGSCPYLGIVQAPDQYQIVGTDFGGSLYDDTQIPGWVAIYEKRSGGRGHTSVAFARLRGTSMEQIKSFMEQYPNDDLSVVSQEGRKIVVQSASLGLWIGKKGRWAKAYRQLGIQVEFRDLYALKCSGTLVNHLSECLKPYIVVEKCRVGSGPCHNKELWWGLSKEGGQLYEKLTETFQSRWKKKFRGHCYIDNVSYAILSDGSSVKYDSFYQAMVSDIIAELT